MGMRRTGRSQKKDEAEAYPGLMPSQEELRDPDGKAHGDDE